MEKCRVHFVVRFGKPVMIIIKIQKKTDCLLHLRKCSLTTATFFSLATRAKISDASGCATGLPMSGDNGPSISQGQLNMY